MADRKWKEGKQQPSMLPGPAVPGCCLVSLYFLWAILCPQAVVYTYILFKSDFLEDFCDVVLLYSISVLNCAPGLEEGPGAAVAAVHELVAVGRVAKLTPPPKAILAQGSFVVSVYRGESH